MGTIDQPVDTNGYSSTVRRTLSIGANGTSRASESNPVPTKTVSWNNTANGTAAVGSNVVLTPTGTTKTLYEIIITTVGAVTDGATLKVYKDSVAAGNILFDGYLLNLDGNSSILFPDGEECTTSWIVLVTGGTGTVYASARYR